MWILTETSMFAKHPPQLKKKKTSSHLLKPKKSFNLKRKFCSQEKKSKIKKLVLKLTFQYSFMTYFFLNNGPTYVDQK